MTYRKVSFVFIVWILFFVSSPQFVWGQEVWYNKTEFPGSARNKSVSFVIDGSVYVGTGTDESGVTDNFWKYTPATDTWVQVASLTGVAREDAVSFVLNGKGYIATGYGDNSNYLKDVWQYDPVADTWQVMNDFGGSARQGAVAFVIGDKAYISTGKDADGYLKDLWEYDDTSDTWAQKADLPADPRVQAFAFAIGGKGYVGSGFAVLDGASTMVNGLYSYEATTNTWQEEIYADMALSVQQAVAYSIGDKAFFGCGTGSTKFYEYDPFSKSIQFLGNVGDASEDNRYEATAFAIGGKGYVGLGKYMVDIFNTSYKKDFWTFGEPDPVAAPTNLQVVIINADSIQISWQDNATNESEFYLERYADTTSVIKETYLIEKDQSSFTDTSFASSTRYFYRVNAGNDYQKSSYTPFVAVDTPPGIPTGLSVWPVGVSQVSVAWTYPSLGGTFEIERSTNQIDFVQIATVTGRGDYIDTDLDNGAIYYYRIRQVSEDMASDYTDTLFAVTGELGAWEARQTLNDFRYGSGIGESVNGKAYIGVGTNGADNGTAFYEFNPEDESWSRRANYPLEDMSYAKSFVAGDHLYVGGGSLSSGYTEKYYRFVAESNQWVPIADAPVKNVTGAFGVGNKGYLIWGHNLYEYNTATDTWTSIGASPFSSRYRLVSFALDGKVYVGGGHYGSQLFKDFYQFDPSDNSWTRIADFPGTTTYLSGTFSYGGLGYIASGRKQVGYVDVKEIWAYDPANDQWLQKAQLPGIGRMNAAAFVVDDYAYLVGGTGKNGNISAEVWRYDMNVVNAPSPLIAEMGSGRAPTLSWSDNSDSEISYIVQRKLVEDSVFVTIDSLNANTTEYLDQSFQGLNTYQYRVGAISAQQKASFSPTATIEMLNAPYGVGHSSYTDPADYLVYWSFDQSVDTFQIEKTWFRDSAQINQQVFRVSAEDVYYRNVQYTISDPVPDGYYVSYRIKAMNAADTSDYSEEDHEITPLFEPAQVNLQLIGEDSVVFAWQDMTDNETSYLVQKSLNNDIINVDTLLANTQIWIDTTFESSGQYEYKVQAINSMSASSWISQQVYITLPTPEVVEEENPTEEESSEELTGEEEGTENPVEEETNEEESSEVITSVEYKKPDLIEAVIFPNPATDKVYIKGTKGQIVVLKLYNAQGKLLLTSQQKELDLVNFPAGVYYIQVHHTDGMPTFRLIKK